MLLSTQQLEHLSLVSWSFVHTVLLVILFYALYTGVNEIEYTTTPGTFQPSS
jgi:hypothetical protein